MDDIDRLIDNAYRAHARCSSEWGKGYWSMVITTLLRKYNKCH